MPCRYNQYRYGWRGRYDCLFRTRTEENECQSERMIVVGVLLHFMTLCFLSISFIVVKSSDTLYSASSSGGNCLSTRSVILESS